MDLGLDLMEMDELADLAAAGALSTGRALPALTPETERRGEENDARAGGVIRFEVLVIPAKRDLLTPRFTPLTQLERRQRRQRSWVVSPAALRRASSPKPRGPPPDGSGVSEGALSSAVRRAVRRPRTLGRRQGAGSLSTRSRRGLRPQCGSWQQLSWNGCLW